MQNCLSRIKWACTFLLVVPCRGFVPSAGFTRAAARGSALSITASQQQHHLQAMRRMHSTSDRIRELSTSREVTHTLDRAGEQVVLFGARYCRACRQLLPRLQQLANRCPGVPVNRVYHTTATAGAFAHFEIKTLPTILVQRDGHTQTTFPATAESILWLERTLMGKDDSKQSFNV